MDSYRVLAVVTHACFVSSFRLRRGILVSGADPWKNRLSLVCNYLVGCRGSMGPREEDLESWVTEVLEGKYTEKIETRYRKIKSCIFSFEVLFS